MPPICVLSNARWTSATKAPSVTSASGSPNRTVATGTKSPARGLGLVAERGERDERVGGRGGREREAGDDHRVAAEPRRRAGGSRTTSGICAATKTAENTMPVKVIMPPARALKIDSTAERPIGRPRSPACSVDHRQHERRHDRDEVGGRAPGTHIAELSQMRRRRTRPAGRTSWWAWWWLSRGGRPLRCGDPAHAQAVQRPGERRQRRRPRSAPPRSSDSISPASTATVVIATTSGSCVAVNSASAWRSSRSGSTPRYSSIAGVPRTTRNSTKKIASLPTPDQLENSAIDVEAHAADDEEERDEDAEGDRGQLRVEQRHLARGDDLARDQAGGEPAEQEVEPEVGGDQREREHEHDEPAHRELRARLDRPLDHRHRVLGRADGQHGDDRRRAR